MFPSFKMIMIKLPSMGTQLGKRRRVGILAKKVQSAEGDGVENARRMRIFFGVLITYFPGIQGFRFFLQILRLGYCRAGYYRFISGRYSKAGLNHPKLFLKNTHTKSSKNYMGPGWGGGLKTILLFVERFLLRDRVTIGSRFELLVLTKCF